MATKRKLSSEGLPDPKRFHKPADDDDPIYQENRSDVEYAPSDEISIRSDSIHETPATPISTTSTRYPSELKTLLCPFEGCLKAFNRPARLQEHLRSHKNERLFQCTQDGCDKTFLRASHLNHHIKSAHTGIREYICDRPGCGKSFVTGTRLRRHLAAHDGRDKYRCTEYPPCQETFRKHSTLQKHVMTAHLKQKPFQCTYVDPNTGQKCTMAFETAGHLRAHESRLHTDNRFICTECSPPSPETHSVAFPSYALLQAHIRSVHPPQCPNCSITCSTSRELRRHLEVAHGDVTLEERKVFTCTVSGCNRSFTKKGNLTVHIRTVHEGEKRFACGETDLSSSTKVAGWSGPGCGKRYGSKLALEEHIRTAHLGYLNAKAERRQRNPSTSTSKKSKQTTPSTLATLTGQGYAEETGRHIPCFIDSCPHRFHRDYDLWVHMSGKHDYSEDRIRDMFLQRALLADAHEPPSTDLLGIYGLEFDTAAPAYDPYAGAQQQQAYEMEENAFDLATEYFPKAELDANMQDANKIPGYDNDDMALIDPVLAYNLMQE